MKPWKWWWWWWRRWSQSKGLQYWAGEWRDFRTYYRLLLLGWGRKLTWNCHCFLVACLQYWLLGCNACAETNNGPNAACFCYPFLGWVRAHILFLTLSPPPTESPTISMHQMLPPEYFFTHMSAPTKYHLSDFKFKFVNSVVICIRILPVIITLLLQLLLHGPDMYMFARKIFILRSETCRD